MAAWVLPQGFAAGEIFHPLPDFIPVGPLASFAHEGTPVFLVPLTAPENLVVGETVSIAIDATWQACEEICVPEEGRFEFTAPVIGAAQRKETRPSLFEEARSALPAPFNGEATLASRNSAYFLDLPMNDGLANDGVFFFPGQEGYGPIRSSPGSFQPPPTADERSRTLHAGPCREHRSF